MLSNTLSPDRYWENSSSSSSLLRVDLSHAANSRSQAGSGQVSRRPKVAATWRTARSQSLADGELGIAMLQNDRGYVLELLFGDTRVHRKRESVFAQALRNGELTLFVSEVRVGFLQM